MYADDSVLLTSSNSLEELEISSFIALNLAIDYCCNNDLVFNESKSQQLNFGRVRDLASDIPQLQVVDSLRYLGVVVDNTLTWENHLDHLCGKLSSALYALRRTKAVSSDEATRTAYNALFVSHLRYGIAIWGATSHTNLERVLILQKRALRIMANLGWRESCRGVFRERGLLTVVSLYILEVVLLVTKKNCLRNEDLHSYATRNAENFNLPAHKSKLFEKKPSYAGAKFFNILPGNIKSASNQTMLKNILTSWLVQRPFYSVKEFLEWRNFEF